MSVQSQTDIIIDNIKAAYPDIDWSKFEDIDRALNWELLFGPQTEGYWTDIEPLDHYEWQGFTQAVSDIREILDPLPERLFWDSDCDDLWLSDPYEDERNWEHNENRDLEDEQSYMGPWEYEAIDPRKVLMYKSTWEQVYR